MARHFGVVQEDATLNVFFTTNAADGGREAIAAALAAADILFYKDGTLATITGTVTISEEFGSIVGLQKLALDLSGDADFTNGSDWTVVLYSTTGDETIDAQAVSAVICTFTIETLAAKAQREYGEKMFIGHVVSTVTGNDQATGKINLTEIVDPQTEADDLNGEILTHWNASDGIVRLLRVSDFAVSNLLATCTQLDGTFLPEIVAAGDMLWRTGQFTAGNLAGGAALATSAQATTAQADLDTITGTAGVLIGTDAMTEAYSTDQGTFTVPQALYEIHALLAEQSVSGTTVTVKKRDGSTSAMTYTLDSATAPTSITRAT